MGQDRTAARRVLLGRRALIVVAIVIAVIVIAWFLESTKPRRIVLASGPIDGLHHELALRYQAILARNGVAVVERVTTGAEENARLLRDPQSDVDVAFMFGGVVPPDAREGLEMLAGLYFRTSTRTWSLRSRNGSLGPEGLSPANPLADMPRSRMATGIAGTGVVRAGPDLTC